MNTFTYQFEELPLVICNGIEAAFINGSAEIEYGLGGFNIAAISVEGFGERVNGKRQWPQVPAPEPLAVIIRERLEGEWLAKLGRAVQGQLASDREAASPADRLANTFDHARKLRAEA